MKKDQVIIIYYDWKYMKYWLALIAGAGTNSSLDLLFNGAPIFWNALRVKKVMEIKKEPESVCLLVAGKEARWMELYCTWV